MSISTAFMLKLPSEESQSGWMFFFTRVSLDFYSKLPSLRERKRSTFNGEVIPPDFLTKFILAGRRNIGAIMVFVQVQASNQTLIRACFVSFAIAKAASNLKRVICDTYSFTVVGNTA